jgi:ribA/ribD-fused uncharacterized protein
MDIISKEIVGSIGDFVAVAQKDHKAELECKLLSDKIQTKDVADRLMKTIQGLAIGSIVETHNMTFTYPDKIRVNVAESGNIFKLISTGSFRGLPLSVERKEPYYKGTKRDTIDVPEAAAKFTLRSETQIRKDWEGDPNDPKSHVRIIHRRSYKTSSELFRIDFSMIKTRGVNVKQSLKTMLKQQPKYELEIEFVNHETKIDHALVAEEFIKIVMTILQSYYQTSFVLPVSDIQRYMQEFKMSNTRFYNPVTMMRRHLSSEIPYNISKGYTVTVKADGERSGLYVSRDRKLLKITPNFQVTWTGITALNDSHIGDFVDGEFILDKNLFCIFDVYRFRNRDVRSLPLMKTDEDMSLNSRLGVTKAFIEDLKTQFTTAYSLIPLRIESKQFLAGDGPSMEEAIRTVLNTEYEFERDGLIFTPRDTGVAPTKDTIGKTWTRVYKWKPADQNSIDFLLTIDDKEGFDPVLNVPAKQGQLYVSRTPTDNNIIYPRETMNGEYKEPSLPESLQKLAELNTRIPSVFQPSTPRSPDAYQITVPLNDKGLTVDKNGDRVESNTIIECAYDIKTQRWTILRTRYDKTYQYRVLHERQFGNDIATADSIWTSMHVPITEEMLSSFMSADPNSSLEDDYYRDDLARDDRVFKDVYTFHNRVKDELYRKSTEKDKTLLELAMGRGGDLPRWKKAHLAKVVGIDLSLANITTPIQGAAIRYLDNKRKYPHTYLPPSLFLEGDITHFPLFEQEDKYMPILLGTESAPTEYLEQFRGLQEFDLASCQFAIHYACETEDTFRAFVKNVHKYCTDTFFGTCLDGQSVYSLLMGKKTHLFGSDKQLAGEFTKLYEDRETWSEEFGMGIRVFLESFEKPAVEYLVPFGKVVDIFGEYGFSLQESSMFSELYETQKNISLTHEQQTYTFMNRTFIFKRTGKKKEPEPEPEPLPGEPEPQLDELVSLPEPTKKEKRKLKKNVEEELVPVLFNVGDETGGEFIAFSNDAKQTVEIAGTTYPTVTHYVGAMEALESKNDPVHEKIMKAASAKAAKAYLKKLNKNEVWEAKKDQVMRDAIRAKFTQHPELRLKLLGTDKRPIGFADARDIYWGIGTSMDTDKAKSASKWRGLNKLGKILEELRTRLAEESN